MVTAIPRTARMSPEAETLPSRWRLALVALIIPVLAVLAAAQTLAIVGETQRPDQAVTIAPWDGSARAHLAKAAYGRNLPQLRAVGKTDAADRRRFAQHSID